MEHSEEIMDVHTNHRSELSHDQVIQWIVHSDSVQCLGKVNDSKDATIRWGGQVEEFKMSFSYKELMGIDGEAI